MGIKVAIIEDDNKFANLLAGLLESTNEYTCVGISNSITEAKLKLGLQKPDIVLLDIQLPDGLGSAQVSKLKLLAPAAKFVMCTSFEDDAYIFESLRNGANGYIIKLDMPDKILSCLHDVINGGAPMSNIIARKVVEHFKIENNKLESLTNKENELLQYLAEGYMYKEIAQEMAIGIDTVKKHCSNIYKKLHVSSKTAAINMYKAN